MAEPDRVYYRNHAGAVALSLEDEDWLILPNGRCVAVQEPWEEDGDEYPHKVTPAQEEALTELLDGRKRVEIERVEANARQERLAAEMMAWVDDLFEAAPPPSEFDITLFDDLPGTKVKT